MRSINNVMLFWALAAAALNVVHAEEFLSVDEATSEFLLSDTNHDGCIDREELRNAGNRFFAAIDLNGDGMITGEEHMEPVAVNGEPVVPDAVHIAMFQAELRRALARADKDADGCLDADEWGVSGTATDE